MRVYVPASWGQLRHMQTEGGIPGPLRGCAVDPRWRADTPDVDEEEWEYEAQLLAAAALTVQGAVTGMVLAIDVPGALTGFDDGWVDVPGPVARRQVGAVLDADLAWYGVQELAGLLDG
jgi:hypothetical protein